MPVIPGDSIPPPQTNDLTNFHRRVFITDRNGVEHEIVTEQDLLDIVAQMTPEERKDWEARYRFAPVQNLTGNQDYTGTALDVQ